MAAAELVAETEPETEGACGWSKHQVSVELMGGGQADVRAFFLSFHHQKFWFVCVISHLSVYLSVCLQTLYVVDPLPWCPHLDSVKPLPPSGIDVFMPCQDCGSDAENWTCLTCYQVTCLTCRCRSRVSQLLAMLVCLTCSPSCLRCSVAVTLTSTW